MDDNYEDNQGVSPPLSPVCLTETVKDIMGKIVAKNSARNYARQNTHFVLYCFESADLRDRLLEPWFVEKLKECRNVSARKKYAMNCFESMRAEDDNCPFVLSNLTFAHFSTFLSTRTRTRGKARGKPNSLGIASFDQAKSALVHLFRMSKYKMLVDFSEKLKMFMKGLKRHVASKKMESGDSQIVGKKKMDFKVYEKICELFLKEEGEEYLFARCFLTLEWNLMARSESIVSAHFYHITWEDDSLVFRFAKSKTDQTGRNANQAWHVYATPDKPATCPVLALATYVFLNPGLTDMWESTDDMRDVDAGVCDNVCSGRLFPGGDQYGRFMDCLYRVTEKNAEEFLLLGIKPGDLGSHSARKGASSFASAGSTVSPPMVSICLRAMWSMGPVKERYLQYEKAGDQYLGRVVSGLDVNNVSFAVSPPHFESGPEDDVREKVNILLRDFTVGGDNISGEVFQVLYYCFASLCYHFDFLVKITPRQSKLQATPFFTNIPNYAREAAVVKFPWNKTASTPSFTGLPPHVCILAQLEGLKAALESSKDDIIAGVKSDLDGRRLGSQSYFDKEEIIAKMGELHVELMRKVEVVGRKSSTAIQAGYGDADFSGGDQFDVLMPAATSAHTLVDPGSGKRFQIFYSAGIISRVRADFVFPKMTLCTLITCWFCGNESAKTVPFKLLRPMEIKKVSERYKLSKMKLLMLGVQLAAERCGVWRAQRGTWDVGLTVRLYEAVRPYFTYPSKTSIRRDEQISWNTVYNLYLKHEKKFAVDL